MMTGVHEEIEQWRGEGHVQDVLIHRSLHFLGKHNNSTANSIIVVAHFVIE